MNVQQMMSTHPEVQGDTTSALMKCIEECYSCAQICVSCADACLAEQQIDMLRQCIRLNLDCADVCGATGTMASRRTGSNEPVLKAALELCALACRACADECQHHAEMHEHCRMCAESCRSCQRACEATMQDIGGAQAH